MFGKYFMRLYFIKYVDFSNVLFLHEKYDKYEYLLIYLENKVGKYCDCTRG